VSHVHETKQTTLGTFSTNKKRYILQKLMPNNFVCDISAEQNLEQPAV
jgi:hypothetical protein